MKEALQAIITNLHILVVSVLITALALGIIGTTPGSDTAHQRWRIMTVTNTPSSALGDQPLTKAFTPSTPRVPWPLHQTL